jgi:hypothetical protein
MQNVAPNFRITDYISSEVDFTNAERIKTGFYSFDSSIGGFRKSGTYLVAGAEKSGKSSFLLQSVFGFVSQGKKVAFFDTELEGLMFYSRLLALEKNIPVKEAEIDLNGIKEIQQKYTDKIIRFDYEHLSVNGMFDFDLTLRLAKDAVNKLGCEILVFDNITTYQTQDKDSKNLVLPMVISKIINLTKELKVWSFLVTHLKPDVKVSNLPDKVKDYIKSEEPEKIFSDSTSIIRKPTTSDIYGGQQALSQLSGTIIIWRPYQHFSNSEKIKRFCQVLAVSFRDSSSKDSLFDFNEEKVRFSDTTLTTMSSSVPSYLKED